MTNASAADLRRLLSSTGIYAVAALAQQGVGFLLIPIYTRCIEPSDYGVLEILNAFASIAFALLTIGLSSAINKCYHRDCATDDEQASVLATALCLDIPLLLLAAGGALLYATPISRLLIGSTAAAPLLPLVIGAGVCSSVVALLLAGLRAQERAAAFSVITLVQFIIGLGLNIVFVVAFGWGVRGVFLGNLLSNAAVLPMAAVVAGRGSRLRFNPQLVQPLLSFGALLIPVMLAGWTMDLSDRYVLRLYRGLDAVAVYGIGYKFGMILQIAVVWPFQLAWPAFSFAISRRHGHQETYARTMTYLALVLVFCVLAVSLFARAVVPVIVGAGYRDAYRVVPLVALAYALNGIQYCVSPGVHITGNTKYLSVLAGIAAILNIALNLVLIPAYGMMGAAWSTVIAFLFLAASTTLLSQRTYPIVYEYGKLAKALAAGAVVYVAATLLAPQRATLAVAWYAGMALLAFPALLAAIGFFDVGQLAAAINGVRRWLLTAPDRVSSRG